MKETKRLAICSLVAAVGIVVMVIGSMLGIAIYAAPMLAGMILTPIGKKYGIKYQLTTFATVALLSIMLVADVEQSLLFLVFLGWYPAVRPKLQNLSKTWIRMMTKLVIFNIPVITAEFLVFTMLVPQEMEKWIIATLIVLGNVTFVLYDILVPRMEIIVSKYADRIIGSEREYIKF